MPKTFYDDIRRFSYIGQLRAAHVYDALDAVRDRRISTTRALAFAKRWRDKKAPLSRREADEQLQLAAAMARPIDEAIEALVKHVWLSMTEAQKDEWDRYSRVDRKDLGLAPGSQTQAAFDAGLISEAEARRRADAIRHRHEGTDYDALLKKGVDRDVAREMIRV